MSLSFFRDSLNSLCTTKLANQLEKGYSRLEVIEKPKLQLMYQRLVLKFTPKVRFYLIILLMIFPALLCFAFIKIYGVNVVFWDQWELVPLFDKMYTGHLTFADLFAQHNEHRIFFPRIIMLLMGAITHYNNLAEMYFSWFLMCLISYVIFIVYIRKFGYTERSLIKFVPVMWLIFSLRQFQNLLWGFQIAFYLLTLFFLLALYFLATSKRLGWRFSFSIISGVICTFSLASGLLVWPIGLILLFILFRMQLKASRWLYLKIGIVWSVVGVLSYLAYFIGYIENSNHPSFLYFIQHPVSTLGFLLTSIGSPLASELYVSMGIGLLILFLYIWVAGLLINNKLNKGLSVPFFISMVLFALLSIALLILGRAELGIEQSFSSHYTTITLLGIIGLYLLIISLKIRHRHLQLSLLGGMVLLVALGVISTDAHALIKDGVDSRDYLNEGAYYLSTYKFQSDQLLVRLYPSLSVLRQRAEILEKYKLNVFSRPVLETTLQKISLPAETNNIIYGLTRIDNYSDVIQIEGWAFNKEESIKDSQTYLVLRSNTQTYVFNTLTIKRTDVTRVFSNLNLNLDYSGFIASIPCDMIINDHGYTVGIYIQKGENKALLFTDKVLQGIP